MYSIQKDNNLNIITRVIDQLSPGSEVILFGSRAAGIIHNSSDYDILVAVDNKLTVAEKRSLSSRIRKQLAEYLIDSDIIVSDRASITSSYERPGSVIKEALMQGIKL